MHLFLRTHVFSYENETITGLPDYVTTESKLNSEKNHWWSLAALAKSIDSALFRLDLIKPYLMMKNEQNFKQNDNNIGFQSNPGVNIFPSYPYEIIPLKSMQW